MSVWREAKGAICIITADLDKLDLKRSFLTLICYLRLCHLCFKVKYVSILFPDELGLLCKPFLLILELLL